MKKIVVFFVLLLLICWAVAAHAVDIAAIDKISVLMPREKVITILGAPAEKTVMANGLIVEIYPASNALPLIHTGCIYDSKKNLVGQSFVFFGNTGDEILQRLKVHGYVPLQQEGGFRRLAGFDDDTGRPVILVIEHHENLTTITTFEKNFYEGLTR